jgi:hypothetical protein
LGGIGPRTAALFQRGEALPDAPGYRAQLFKIGFGGEVALFPKASLYVYSPLLRCAYEAVQQKRALSRVFNGAMKLFF